jgi:inner membrane protein
MLGVGLLLLFPLNQLEDFVAEQDKSQKTQHKTLAQTWGGAQSIIAPVLVLPYTEHFTSIDTITDNAGENRVISKDIFNDRTAILLPKSLEIRADLKTAVEHPEIADAYKAHLTLAGTFDHAPLLNTNDGTRDFKWEQAYLVLGISNTQALDEVANLTWNDNRLALEPGTQQIKLLATGLHALLATKPPQGKKTAQSFKLNLNLRGSQALSFAPLGELTSIRMTSGWATPNFANSLLPSKRTLSDNGFSAEWQISNLARNYPQYWMVEDTKQLPDLQQSVAGVRLDLPPTAYANILSLMPFAIYSIGFMFICLFAFSSKRTEPLHALQYTLLGLGMLAFYAVLTALVGHLDFDSAYISSAIVITLIITAYIGLIFKKLNITLLSSLILSALYILNYGELAIPQYSLLIDVGLLGLGLLILMFTTYNYKALKPVLTTLSIPQTTELIVSKSN